MVDQAAVDDRGDERRFGAAGGIEAFGGEPDFDECFLDGVIDLRRGAAEVSLRKSPSEPAVFVHACGHRGRISFGDALQNGFQLGSDS